MYSLEGRDIYYINDSVETAKEWQLATVLEVSSTPHPRTPARGGVDGRMGACGGKMDCGTAALAGWSDAAFGDQRPGNKCRLGFVSVLMSSTLLAHVRFLDRQETGEERLGRRGMRSAT